MDFEATRYQTSRNRSNDFVVDTNNKSFDRIRKECIYKKVLFEDVEFPAQQDSLYYSKIDEQIVWKRPKEICDDPKFFIKGKSRMDINQGRLDNSWILAAMSSLSIQDSLFSRVVPNDQSFEDGQYAGIFQFHIWQYGKWYEVLVDDQLPTYQDKLLFTHSKDQNEFWSALLEKAYAKLNGSYEALKGGHTGEAMEDFTGGITETFETKDTKIDLYNLITISMQKQALIGCSIESKPNETEAKLENGLVKGHAYSVTGFHKFDGGQNKGTRIIRIRNPWGNEREYLGDWADNSDKWNSVSDADKEYLKIEFKSNGENWMSFADFLNNFTTLSICSLSPDIVNGLPDKRSFPWKEHFEEDSWIKNSTAGGCRNFPDTFYLNHQYYLLLKESPDDAERTGCTVVISLMQKNRRLLKRKGANSLTIGFALYKVEKEQFDMYGRPLGKDFVLYHKSVARSKQFLNSRSITSEFVLPPGEYIVIPSTFKPDEEGEFVLRVFTDNTSESAFRRLDSETMLSESPRSSRIKKLTPEQSASMDEKYRQIFDKVSGTDGEIDPFELAKILNSILKKYGNATIDVEATKSLIYFYDDSATGRIDYNGFEMLFISLKKWMVEFTKHDSDRDDFLDVLELKKALTKFGFKFSTPSLKRMMARYGNKKGKISIQDFILIAAKCGAAHEHIQKLQKRQMVSGKTGGEKISLTVDELMDTIVLL